MNNDQEQVFYFMFGYHDPDSWALVQKGDDFDLDSTGILAISASDESLALDWGQTIAKWYLDQLFEGRPNLNYSWSPKHYSNWIELKIPNGCEDTLKNSPIIEAGAYPVFSIIREAMED